MLKALFRAACAAVIVCAGWTSAFAWHETGHKITGYIAWQRLSPAARNNIIRILRAAPEDSDISTFYIQYSPVSEDAKRLSYFMLITTWADIVRDNAFPVRYARYHRSNWHYSDTFWRQVNGRAEIITDKEPGGQGVNKLVDFDRVMRDAASTDADKAAAMSWFLHVGGDLHQPLHTSGRHTDREQNGDQGGNLFLLTPEGTPREQQLNLHSFWDGIVGRNVPFIPGQCEDDYLRSVAESIMLRHPFEGAKPGLALGRYADWQQESFRLAVTEVFRPDLVRFAMPSDEYRRNAYRVSEQRLAMAGYRLGETLEQIFGTPRP